MVVYFSQEKLWSYSEATTLSDAFGPFKAFDRVGRQTQLHQAWSHILTYNWDKKGKSPALYFHGSPGLGKTYLLRELFSKKNGDFPSESAKAVKALKFLVLDFNRSACRQAKIFKNDFKECPNLFALSRLFYVTFAAQSKLTWIQFLRKAVVPLIRAGLTDELGQLMEQQIRIAKGEGKCVILVDEVLKTRELGVAFAKEVRSSVCDWMDQKLCDIVLFSSLDAEFIRKERTASGRAVLSITTLPLLKPAESAKFLRENINAVFIDAEGYSVNREYIMEQLAVISGGHPRSLEYIIDVCKKNLESNSPIHIEYVIKSAAKALCGAYDDVTNWQGLFNVVFLAEQVKKGAFLDGKGRKSETFRSLVTRGVLIDSFGEEITDYFVPTLPELFLHTWLLNLGAECLNEEVRRLLGQILETRYKFASVDFEIIHSSWEQMMRHVRQGQLKYSRIPLNDLYRLNVTNSSAPAASCLVDGSSILREFQYIKNTKIVLQPNTIYNPKYKQNSGWDRLIVLEAFPSGGNSSQRYLLPLFIQNKFNKDNSTTKLKLDDVKKAHNHCMKFVRNRIKLASGFSLLSTTDDNSVLLFVAKTDKNNNAVTEAPSNILFCFEEDLKRLYGPTLKSFVNTLQPGHSIYVRTPK